jgi:DNA-binding IclR family transcriptional regulator
VEDRQPSPPTDRVVRVLRLLSERDDGASVTEVAEHLELNRATCTSILASLEQWGWVTRLHAAAGASRRFGLGDGLLSIAEVARERLPVLDLAPAVLASLTDETGYRSTLSRSDGHHLTTIAAHGDRARTVPGSGVGNRMPLRPPFGVVIAAWSSDAERARWFERSDLPADERAQLAQFLDSVRRNGFAARRFDSANQPALSTIQQLIATLGDATEQSELREELVRLLLSYSGTGYTYDELDGPGQVDVSYLVVPVFERGLPRYQLELHVLRGAMARSEMRHCVDLLLAAAKELEV